MPLVMYERLERYDENTGAFKAAHVKLFDTDLGKDCDAMSYAAAAALGFTQADILSQVESGAILAADAARAALTVEQAAHAVTRAEASMLRAEVSMLRAQLALLQP